MSGRNGENRSGRGSQGRGAAGRKEGRGDVRVARGLPEGVVNGRGGLGGGSGRGDGGRRGGRGSVDQGGRGRGTKQTTSGAEPKDAPETKVCNLSSFKQIICLLTQFCSVQEHVIQGASKGMY
jgi:hypothetical protein